MTFWNDPARLFPKQSHRWVISFGQHDENNSSAAGGVVNANTTSRFFAKAVEKPSFDIKTTQVKYMHSHAFNFPQRVIWNPITITLYDVTKRKLAYVKETINSEFEIKNGKYFEKITGRDLSLAATPGKLALIREDATLGQDTLKHLNSPRLNKDDVDVNSSNSVIDADKSTQLFFYRFLQESGYYVPEELDREDFLMRFRDFNFKNNMISSLVGESSYGKEASFNYRDPLTKKEFINTKTWNTIDISELNEFGKVIETWKLYNPLITSVKPDKLDYSTEGILNLTIGVSYDWAKLIPEKSKTNTLVVETERKLTRKKHEEYANIPSTGSLEYPKQLTEQKTQKQKDLEKAFNDSIKEGGIDKKYLEDVLKRGNASKETKDAAESVLKEVYEREKAEKAWNEELARQAKENAASTKSLIDLARAGNGQTRISEGTPDQLLEVSVLRGVEEDRAIAREVGRAVVRTAEIAVDQNLTYLRESETYRRSQNLDPTEIETSRNQPVGPPPVQPSPQNSNSGIVVTADQEVG